MKASDIIKYETGRSIEPPLTPSWNCIWRHYSAAGVPIWTKFGRPRLMRNSTPITMTTGRKIPIWRAFVFQTGSSYISAVNWDVDEIWFLDKFWTLDECNDIKYKLEVVLRVCATAAAILKLLTYIITLSRMARLGAKVGYLMQNSTQIYCDPVKIAKTTIAIWQTFIFPNHK